MPITRPALRWYGGKWRLAPWIISHLPAHDAYCQPQLIRTGWDQRVRAGTEHTHRFTGMVP